MAFCLYCFKELGVGLEGLFCDEECREEYYRTDHSTQHRAEEEEMKVYLKFGQVFCGNCGTPFVPQGKVTELGYLYMECPNPECNRGTVAQVEEDSTFCVEVEVVEEREE